MFHLHSLKELPPKRMCETINFTSEVEATISSQESQPPIQRQVDRSTASEAVEINITEPFQPADFNFPKKHCGKQNRAFQSKWFSEFPWLHYNEQSNSVLCFIFMQQNAKSNLRAARSKEVCFISKGFSNWEKALSRFKEPPLRPKKNSFTHSSLAPPLENLLRGPCKGGYFFYYFANIYIEFFIFRTSMLEVVNLALLCIIFLVYALIGYSSPPNQGL